jgi:ComF family protein
MRALLDLLDLPWPRHCLACAVGLPSASESSEGAEGIVRGRWSGSNAPPLCLCPDCSARLVAIDRSAACRTCARPLAPLPPGSEAGRCGACLADPPAFERLIALWRYEEPLRSVVEALKFGRLDFLGAHFARALGGELARLRSETGWVAPELVVPVPLPWPRRLARGFNQTELVSGPLGAALGRPAPRALARNLFTRRQTGQGRRGRRAAGPFRVRRPEAVAGRSILLVDDVFTTGATVRGASAALTRAGASRVEVAVVGWTPLERGGEPARTPPRRHFGPTLDLS